MKKNRALLYGANAVILTLIVFGIIAALNYAAFKHGGRYDVTSGGLYSLSDQTVKVLDNIYNDVEVLAFFKEVGTDRSEFNDLINRYRDKTDRIKVRFVDPDKEPGVTEKYEVNEYGTVVLVSGGKNIKVRLADLLSGGIVSNAEEEVTNAIIKLSRGTKKTVYFLTGHGEGNIEQDAGEDSAAAEGLGSLKNALLGESFEVKELVILREGNVPQKDSILVVASPKKPLLEKEAEAVEKYLDGGGRGVFMIEPRSAGDMVSLLKKYGFDIGNNIIIDPSSKLAGGGDIAPIVAEYPPHEITEGFNFATLFPYSRGVEVVQKDGFITTVIAMTSEYSWAEENLELFDQGTAEKEAKDKPGPLGIAAVSEGEKGGSKIAVFGSADFISNRFFDFSGNSDLFLNTINWVAGDDYLISIRPKTAGETKLAITVNQMRAIFAFTVILLPSIILISGIIVWWKRKNM